MKFVLLLSILLSLILVVLGQQPTISCFYSTSADYGYSCSMEIYNPNGLNNFNEINGTHLVGKTNDDVRYVVIAGPLRSTTIFPSIICETFRNVTQINFASVGIQRIDNDSFSSCLSLEVLILYFNKINRIDVNAFINNKNLTTLELRNNELTEVHENTFVNQEQLTALTLSTNFISDFGDNTFKPLKNLEMLAFNTNFITILKHSWFESLENLQILFIYQNVISDLPKGIFAPLSKMYLLAAAQMNLTVIHSNSFGLLPNLNTIDFYNNKINAFDERLIDNTAIGTLDMISNWCANEWIQDHSESREVLRAAMSACFENYRNLTGESTTTPSVTSTTVPQPTTTAPQVSTTPSCIIGDIDNRVCRLEEFSDNFESEIQILRREKLEMEENFKAAIEDLQRQINELLNAKNNKE